MAEGVGFEPTVPFQVQQFSKLPDSTTLAPFLCGGVCSKKFELISPKICRAGGIPPPNPLPPANGSDPFEKDDFKFFFGDKFFYNLIFANSGLSAEIFLYNSSIFIGLSLAFFTNFLKFSIPSFFKIV